MTARDFREGAQIGSRKCYNCDRSGYTPDYTANYSARGAGALRANVLRAKRRGSDSTKRRTGHRRIRGNAGQLVRSREFPRTG